MDSILEELAKSATNGVERPPQIHVEGLEWIYSGKLPNHIQAASRDFQRLLEDDRWYGEHEGKYVALLNGGEIEDEDLDALLKKAYEKWGYRPIFTALVTREKKVRTLRPRGII